MPPSSPPRSSLPAASLLPCPGCGNAVVEFFAAGATGWTPFRGGTRKGAGVAVGCFACRRVGAARGTEQEAAAAWNALVRPGVDALFADAPVGLPPDRLDAYLRHDVDATRRLYRELAVRWASPCAGENDALVTVGQGDDEAGVGPDDAAIGPILIGAVVSVVAVAALAAIVLWHWLAR